MRAFTLPFFSSSNAFLLQASLAPHSGNTSLEKTRFFPSGNVALGDFTNRLKFDGRLQFTQTHQWQELTLKITSRLAVIEIHSLATNQMAHVKFSNDGTPLLERDFTFADLQNPGALVRALAGNFADGFFGIADLPGLVPDAAAQKILWDARRTRVKIGTEAVPVYRLQTSVLGHPVIVDVSTLGEILHVELPGDISARIDEWSKQIGRASCRQTPQSSYG